MGVVERDMLHIDDEHTRARLLGAVQYLIEREAIESTIDGEDYHARGVFQEYDREDWLRLRCELAGAGEPATYTLVSLRERSDCWHGGSHYGDFDESVMVTRGLDEVGLVSALTDVEVCNKARACCEEARSVHVFMDGGSAEDPDEHVAALMATVRLRVADEVARREREKAAREAARVAAEEAARPERVRAAKAARLAEIEADAAKLRAELAGAIEAKV